jgi:hypothetical protein
MLSRRRFMIAGAAGVMASSELWAAQKAPPIDAIAPALLKRALGSYQKHQHRLRGRDYIGIADYSAPSRRPRFHVLDLASGKSRALLVAHGRGSDPHHSGWVETFSNVPGSAASSQGAFLTDEIYEGRHGRSRRLVGLDPQNNNAESRAIVIHAAWYVSRAMVHDHGKLGRSEGCFAFAEGDLSMVLDRLGPGRLIYSDKVGNS